MHIKILAVALILGTASAAFANDSGEAERGAGQTQTWQDIERSRQEIESTTRQQNASSPENAYDLQTSTKQRSTREKTKDH